MVGMQNERNEKRSAPWAGETVKVRQARSDGQAGSYRAVNGRGKAALRVAFPLHRSPSQRTYPGYGFGRFGFPVYSDCGIGQHTCVPKVGGAGTGLLKVPLCQRSTL